MCVHNNLVCDGHVHCDDASDEDQEECQVCPRKGIESAATFSCTHRDTGCKICAVPCDGKDDFCKNNEDENCDFFCLECLALFVVPLIVFITFTGECLSSCFYSDELNDAGEEQIPVQLSSYTNRDNFELQNMIKEASKEFKKLVALVSNTLI